MGGIDSSGIDNKNGEGGLKVPGSGLHRRGHRSVQRISDSDLDDVPSHPKPKWGRR